MCCALLMLAVCGQPSVSATTAARLELCEARLVYAAERMADAVLIIDDCRGDVDALTKTVSLHESAPPPVVPLVVTTTVTQVDWVWIGLIGGLTALAGFSAGLLVDR